MNIKNIIYEADGKQYTARPATEEELKAANLLGNCNCGDEKCVSGKKWRCMAGGGGSCVWYPTNEVC